MARTQPKPATSSQVTLQQLMGPEHANLYGNVHGGAIMKLVDEAAALAAMRHAQRPCVTVALDSMTFHSPVHVGQLLSCVATIGYVGRTSIEVSVTVHAEDVLAGQIAHTNSAYAVYVALDDNGMPQEVPPLLVTTDEERTHWDSGHLRQLDRLKASRPVKGDRESTDEE
jgi:acyl-CoA hydrolase